MGGRLAPHAEVARRAYQAGAEVMQPEAVDQHPSRERILRAGNGAGQLKPAAPLRERLPLRTGQHRQELPRHGLSPIVRIAANQDMRLDRLGRIHQHHGTGW